MLKLFTGVLKLFSGKSKNKKSSPEKVDLYTIEDLEKEYKEGNFKLRRKLNELHVLGKSDVSILFIDDGGFNITPLNQLGYRDTEVIYDFTSMESLKKYDIIFCDISNVATKIYPIGQGAQLASRIKKEYPNKMIVIFSAQNQKPSFSKYYDDVDCVIDKTVNYDTFSDIIDQYIDSQNNPVKYWKRLKKQMVKQEINSLQIAKMEHYYVKSILEGNNYFKNYTKDSDGICFENVLQFADLIIGMLDLYLRIFWGV